MLACLLVESASKRRADRLVHCQVGQAWASSGCLLVAAADLPVTQQSSGGEALAGQAGRACPSPVCTAASVTCSRTRVHAACSQGS